MVANWVVGAVGRHPVSVLRYESLWRNATGEVARILDFLQVAFDAADLKRLLSDRLAFGERGGGDGGGRGRGGGRGGGGGGGGVRVKGLFTAGQKLFLCSLLRETARLVQSCGLGAELSLEEYLEAEACTKGKPSPRRFKPTV